MKDETPMMKELEAQLADQRAELTGTLSELFKAVPACYDTPADHYREMARRLVEDRDAQKHRAREAEARVVELEAQADEDGQVIDNFNESTPKLLARVAELEREVARLVEKWRVEAVRLNHHATMGIGWKVCADDLEALLAK